MTYTPKSSTFAAQAERPSYDCQTADAERPIKDPLYLPDPLNLP